MKQLLQEAAREIRGLRQVNAILSAKVETMEFMQQMLHARPMDRGMCCAPDVVHQLDETIAALGLAPSPSQPERVVEVPPLESAQPIQVTRPAEQQLRPAAKNGGGQKPAPVPVVKGELVLAPMGNRRGRQGKTEMTPNSPQMIAAGRALKEPFGSETIMNKCGVAFEGSKRAIEKWLARGWIERVERGQYQRTKAFGGAADPSAAGRSLLDQIHAEEAAKKPNED